ncbi:MAG: hypothetical protein WBG73_23185 [Coleofasciculaceae cyanobacterium]
MTAAVKIQPQGFSVQYPRTNWRVFFVEDAAGKFQFRLAGRDFKFEPRDRFRYPTHNQAKQAAFCFLELMKRLERSRLKLNVLSEIGILKFPQDRYRTYELWLVIDRTRYTWEILADDGLCIRSQRWYKRPDAALVKARVHIDREQAVAQIKEIVGWV